MMEPDVDQSEAILPPPTSAFENLPCRSAADRNPLPQDEFPLMPSDNDGFPHFDVESPGPESLQLETRGLTSQPKQGELWRSGLHFKETVAYKLTLVGRPDLAEPVGTCHTEQISLMCTGCNRVNTFWNRCDLFYCPACQPRLARERLESVEWWAKEIRQPKHVVLTLANTRELTKEHVQHLKDSFTRLRRSKFAAGWLGGLYRVEVTNEGKGWHLHMHALIDSRWIDGSGLAVAWHKANRGTGYIVKVKDCRAKDYLAEVTKYAVKGSEIARWSGEQIAAFVDSLKGLRTFGVFGSLYGKRTEWKEFLAGLAEKRSVCACGCSDYKVCTVAEIEWLSQKIGFHPRVDVPTVKRPVQLDLAVIAREVFNLSSYAAGA